MAQGTAADEFLQTAGESQAGLGTDEWFFARLPAAVRDALTPDQKRAIGATLAAQGTRKQPVSIGFSLPFLFRRMFFTIVAGPEKRSTARLALDRQHNPLWTQGNTIFMFGGGAMFFLALFVVILFSSAIIEY